jgi:hypothetical protein
VDTTEREDMGERESDFTDNFNVNLSLVGVHPPFFNNFQPKYHK